MLQPLSFGDGRSERDWAISKQQQGKSVLNNNEFHQLWKRIFGGAVTLPELCFHCCRYLTQCFDFSPFAIEKLNTGAESTQHAREHFQNSVSEYYGCFPPDWKRNVSLPTSSTWTNSGFGRSILWEDDCLSPFVVTASSNDKISSCVGGDVEASYHHSSSLEKQGFQYNKKTEISLGRIFELGSLHFVGYSDSYSGVHSYCGPPLLTMSCLGELGRFGNQLFQYMFLKCCALVHHTSVQTPPWIGESLFALKDDRISVKLPLAVESSHMKANSILTDKLTEYIKSTSTEKHIVEIEPNVLEKDTKKDLVNVDIWGWFQWHTSYYRPFRSYIYSLFRVNPDLKEYLDMEISKKLCPLDGSVTLVGIHIRLGDYKDITASSFAYCAPVSWYLEWLEHIWPQLKNPVLFVASDEINQVEKYFWQYQPKTCHSLGIHMPRTYASVEADFFPDCFTSCLLNQRTNPRFCRAHYLYRITEIDIWNTDPIIHRELSSAFWKRTWDSLFLLYQQQGTLELLRSIFWGLPLYSIRSLLIDVVLGLRRLYWNSLLRKWFGSE
ncbi:hypothetical protein Gasu2_29810 [Galdieria sulphuraria]|nr:hypothetical protein Gasu2_29810 [Galdieria sulphuraria]